MEGGEKMLLRCSAKFKDEQSGRNFTRVLKERELPFVEHQGQVVVTMTTKTFLEGLEVIELFETQEADVSMSYWG